jgi:hypothetical protein
LYGPRYHVGYHAARRGNPGAFWGVH